jgi:hypothetical protein
VIHFQEAIIAIFLHILTNTIATMKQLSIGFFSSGGFAISSEGILILGGVVLVAWFIMFQELPLLGSKNIF